MEINPVLIDWLLAGPPWVAYNTRIELLGETPASPNCATARRAMLADEQVSGLIRALADWPEPALKSHKSAGHPLHLLVFATEIGLRADDPGMVEVVERVLNLPAPEGPLQILIEISPAFGGNGQPGYAWMLCDAPLLLFSLARMGLGDDARVRRAIDYLVSLARPNGWPCAVSPALGKWRGPGRKDDPCPYANLVMLKALAEFPDLRDIQAAHIGVQAALELWQSSRERSPYLFAMGNDFRKLKVPNAWYDLLHLLEVLTHFSWLHDDPRLLEMIDLAAAKADPDGRFIPESIWAAWKGWEFAQKKEPSRWLTLQMLRVMQRMDL